MKQDYFQTPIKIWYKALPKFSKILWPIVDVKLNYSGILIQPFSALVDSGASHSVLHPLVGFGQENFEIAVPTGKMHSADNAHNIFLETAVSSGLTGLLIFLGIIFTAFKKANFTVRMALLAFLIIAQFNPLSIVEIMLFWFLLAIL